MPIELQIRISGPAGQVLACLDDGLPLGMTVDAPPADGRGDPPAWIAVGLTAICAAKAVYDWWQQMQAKYPELTGSAMDPKTGCWHELRDSDDPNSHGDRSSDERGTMQGD